MPADMYQDNPDAAKSSNKSMFLFGALLLAALGALIFIRAKKKKNR
jgi:LPXTG-motif cell wall-anchored protein